MLRAWLGTNSVQHSVFGRCVEHSGPKLFPNTVALTESLPTVFLITLTNRHLLLHRITQAGKSRLFGHRQGLLKHMSQSAISDKKWQVFQTFLGFPHLVWRRVLVLELIRLLRAPPSCA
jgi:hypothetical protein